MELGANLSALAVNGLCEQPVGRDDVIAVKSHARVSSCRLPHIIGLGHDHRDTLPGPIPVICILVGCGDPELVGKIGRHWGHDNPVPQFQPVRQFDR